tara:strand:- start:55 stop:459 length:405 start_codon:yes stop_codon:yes gene_type:complete
MKKNNLLSAVLGFLLLGIGSGALYSVDLNTEYKIIIFVIFFMLCLIYIELWQLNNVGKSTFKILDLIFMQLNLMGRKQSIKANAADAELAKEDKDAEERQKFRDLLGGDWTILSTLITLFIIFVVASLTAEFLN